VSAVVEQAMPVILDQEAVVAKVPETKVISSYARVPSISSPITKTTSVAAPLLQVIVTGPLFPAKSIPVPVTTSRSSCLRNPADKLIAPSQTSLSSSSPPP